MPESTHSLIESKYSDIPDSWQSASDIPSIEDMVGHIKADPIFADSFFFQETNNPENAEDGSYQPLADYQGVAFEELDNNSQIWWQAARGGAKSSTVARWLNGRCLRFPRTEVAIFAPSFRQSKGLFNYCLKYLTDNFGVDSHVYKLEYELAEDPKIGHEPVIVFKNGSRIRAFPCGDGEKLRGLRANIIVIDEFYQFERTLYRSHILPIGNVQIGGQPTKIIHLTTSWYTDCFAYTVLQDIARNVALGRPGYCILDVTLGDVMASGFPFDKQYILHQLESQSDPVTGKPSDELLMTFFNVWLRASANFYTNAVISDCKRSDLPVLEKQPEGDSAPYVLGVDPATVGDDKCQMGVIRCPGQDERQLAAVYSWKHQKPIEIAGSIHKLVDRYPNIKLVFMDKTGAMGYEIADYCAKEVQLIDGQMVKRQPILLWDHPDAKMGRAHIVLSKPSDQRVLNGVMGPRYDSTITGEIDLKNWFHLSMKRVFEAQKFQAPLLTKDEDYYNSERGEIMDNINEALAQFPRIDRIKLADGTLKQDYRGNYYFTRPSKDDGAYAIVYANYAANIYYRETEGRRVHDDPPILWEQSRLAQFQQTETHEILMPRF